ncbi:MULTISPECIES: hypothetical protein [unclassified Mycobacterium]|uniref:hypothetical protein n=1 Tax=unclassified Mycobacterium TaxID=2642494 RepID=UPI00080034D2|nr:MULTISPECIES: hypothetical protein [unclassified Mycobacterium]OBG76737.1 hypothetical protein A5700_21290 [Mycobacterium sp. E1214]OBH30624.1 hypothetical protein A5693_17645 [Mycobacterium sp. E1319]
MRSINCLAGLLDRFDALHESLFAAYDSLTAAERLAALDRLEFLHGRLDALIYEWSGPLVAAVGPPA